MTGAVIPHARIGATAARLKSKPDEEAYTFQPCCWHRGKVGHASKHGWLQLGRKFGPEKEVMMKSIKILGMVALSATLALPMTAFGQQTQEQQTTTTTQGPSGDQTKTTTDKTSTSGMTKQQMKQQKKAQKEQRKAEKENIKAQKHNQNASNMQQNPQ